MADEVRYHLEQYTEDLVRSGLSPEDAARRARIEFGNVLNVKEDCREARGLRLLDELQRDLRQAGRLMRRTPAFTATALATIAICLGANLTIFAVVDALLLRPLPFPDAGRLVRVFNTYPQAGVPDDGSSVTNYYERRGRIAAFTSIALYREGTAVVGGPGSTEREPIARVSPEFFTTLGLGPVMGRAFTDEETTYQTDSVVILTDKYWRQRLMGDPSVVGRRIRLNGLEKTVVGVMPTGFSFLSSNARIYLPLASGADDRAPGRRHSGSSTHMVARLAPGATRAEAQSQIDANNPAMESQNPMARLMADAGFRSLVVPLRADHVAPVRPTLLMIQAGALFLLAIGAVNLVNLLLVRESSRTRELAVRLAIGASRRHVITEVMLETGLIALAGAVLGLGVGAAGIRLLAVLGSEQLPMGARIAFDPRLVFAAFGGAIVLAIGLGAPIAWYNLRLHRSHSGSLLQSETRDGTGGRTTERVRYGFLVAQLALAFVLLSSSGLLALSLKKVMAVSPGFRVEGTLSGQMFLPASSYPDGRALGGFVEAVLDSLDHQPGMQAAGAATNVPLSGDNIKSAVTVQGHRLQPGEPPRGYYAYSVSGDYFGALGIPLLEGRFLNADDSLRAERSCVVDEAFVRSYWPSGGAIGRRLFLGPNEDRAADAFTIVGVVGSVKQSALTEQPGNGAVYFPFAHRLDRQVFLVTRTSVPPESLANMLQTIVRSVDPEVPITDLRSMGTRVIDSLTTRRSPALLAAIFSVVAVLLIGIGTYGVLSYAVALRRREIGLRIALGARPSQIRRQFFSLALRLLVSGSVLGATGAWLTGIALETLLFRVSAVDVTMLAGAGAILSVVCVGACLLPAHRAARISPMTALTDG
jgi:putative ABC transport system permease protein